MSMTAKDYLRWFNGEWLKRQELSPKSNMTPVVLTVVSWDQAVLEVCRGGTIWCVIPDQMVYGIDIDSKGNKRVVSMNTAPHSEPPSPWVPTKKDTKTLWMVRPAG